MEKPEKDLCMICGRECQLIYDLKPDVVKLGKKYPKGDFILAVASFAAKKEVDGVIKHTCQSCMSKMGKK